MKDKQTDLEDFIGIGRRYARLDERGKEVPDPTPIAPPVGYKRQPTLVEQIRAMVRSERLAAEVSEAGYETFEEADDFDVPDDPVDPSTPYEVGFEPPVPIAELRRRQAAAEAPESPPENSATPRPGAPEAPASGGGEAGLDGPKT